MSGLTTRMSKIKELLRLKFDCHLQRITMKDNGE